MASPCASLSRLLLYLFTSAGTGPELQPQRLPINPSSSPCLPLDTVVNPPSCPTNLTAVFQGSMIKKLSTVLHTWGEEEEQPTTSLLCLSCSGRKMGLNLPFLKASLELGLLLSLFQISRIEYRTSLDPVVNMSHL